LDYRKQVVEHQFSAIDQSKEMSMNVLQAMQMISRPGATLTQQCLIIFGNVGSCHFRRLSKLHYIEEDL